MNKNNKQRIRNKQKIRIEIINKDRKWIRIISKE